MISWAALWIFTVVLLAVSARGFLQALLETPTRLHGERVIAFKVGRSYRMLAWLCLSLALLFVLASQFWQTSQQFIATF